MKKRGRPKKNGQENPETSCKVSSYPRQCDAPFGMCYELSHVGNNYRADLVFYHPEHGRIVIDTVVEKNQRIPNTINYCQQHLENEINKWIEKVVI